jgi:hypothetical protein
MVTEINNQGPSNVSHHCGDPTVISVVDVGYSAFGGTSNGRFVGLVQPRVDTFFAEPLNSAYHLEKSVQ